MAPQWAVVVPAASHPAWAAPPVVPSRPESASGRSGAFLSRVVRAPLPHCLAAVRTGGVRRRRVGRCYAMAIGPPGAEASPSSPLFVAPPTGGAPPPLFPPRRRLRPLRVVLVAPEGPLNVGSVARVMKNFGSTELYLVNPVHPPSHPDSVLFAPHAGGVLAGATVVSTVANALAGGVRTVVATTARVRDAKRGGDVLVPPRAAAAALAASEQAAVERERKSPRASADDVADAAAAPPATTAVLFGPESRGLSNEEMAAAQLLVVVGTVDRDGSYDSMNLSHAVGVVLYELSGAAEGGLPPLGGVAGRAEAEGGGGGAAAASSPAARPPPHSPSTATAMEAATVTASWSAATAVVVPAAAARRARLADNVERLLDAVGYFRSTASRSAAALNVRRLLMRAAFSDDDVTLVLGAVRRVERVVRLALWGGEAGEQGEGGKGEELGGGGKRRGSGRR